MRASVSARLGQEKLHETETPQPRTDHLQAENSTTCAQLPVELEPSRFGPRLSVVDEVLRAAVESGAPTGNAEGCNPDRKRGWQWFMLTAVVTRNPAKISLGVQSASGALCRSRLLTVTTTCGNRAKMSGSSWSRPGLPITAAV